MAVVGFEHHDHHHCISDALAGAETYCATHKLKLTPTRRRVLEILAQEHRALGAYEILEHLAKEGLGSQPPVAYRALDFLATHGFVHKIEKLNAYIACAHHGEDHAPGFMICTNCSKVAEVPSASVRDILGHAAKETGFEVSRAMVEVEGLCAACQDSPA